jgi:5-methylthioribose kinase
LTDTYVWQEYFSEMWAINRCERVLDDIENILNDLLGFLLRDIQFLGNSPGDF